MWVWKLRAWFGYVKFEETTKYLRCWVRIEPGDMILGVISMKTVIEHIALDKIT